jgi:hypothetical protein
LIVQNLLPATASTDGASPAALNAAFQVGETALLEDGTIKVQVEHVDSDNDGDGYWVVVSAPLVAQANFVGQGDPPASRARGAARTAHAGPGFRGMPTTLACPSTALSRLFG